MFQIKIDDNSNLIYTDLASSSFSTKREGAVSPKIYTGVKALKVRYRYAVIRFVYSSSTGTWSPKNVLSVYCQRICL